MVDAVVRLLPGVLAEEASENESFTEPLLEHPHYTRPPLFRDMAVPPVLTSGNHGEIKAWRRTQSLIRTHERRPDLLQKANLEPAEWEFLESLKKQSD